jgi:hypothetical protein
MKTESLITSDRREVAPAHQTPSSGCESTAGASTARVQVRHTDDYTSEFEL